MNPLSPWRKVARTVFQVVIALVTLVPLVATKVYASSADIPIVVTQVLAACALITRVMNTPQVDQFLQRFLPWLSAAPVVEGQVFSSELVTVRKRKTGLLPMHAPDRVLDFTPHLRATGTPKVDYIAAMGGGWKMLGNGPDDSVFPGFTGAGVCASVRWANVRRMMTHLAGAEHYPGWDDVLALYRTQNPSFDPRGSADTNGPDSSADGGMDPQKLADYLVKHGGPDGVKAICWGTVDPTNHEAVKLAVEIFGAVWVNIVVFDANEQEFEDGKPWTAAGAIDGGHAVTGGGEWPLKIETWANEAELSEQFWDAVVDGTAAIQSVQIVVWPEHLDTKQWAAGVDEAGLAKDFTALTGRPFPAVAPAPTPVVPAPAPSTSASAALAGLQRYASSKSCPAYVKADIAALVAAEH